MSYAQQRRPSQRPSWVMSTSARGISPSSGGASARRPPPATGGDPQRSSSAAFRRTPLRQAERIPPPSAANPHQRSTTPVSTSKMMVSRGAAPDEVHQMLDDIVRLTMNVSKRVNATSQPATPSATPSAGSTLRTEEIQRIVNRVKAHCSKEIDGLRERNQQLEAEIKRLRSLDAAPRDDGDGVTSPRALRQTIDDLREALASEKRHRLKCEEQSQRMTEEYAKNVSSYEQTIRRLQQAAQQLPPGQPGGSSHRGTPRSSRLFAAPPSGAEELGTPQQQQSQPAARESDRHQPVVPMVNLPPPPKEAGKMESQAHGAKPRAAAAPPKETSPPQRGSPQHNGTASRRPPIGHTAATIVVSDFLDTISRELDEINTFETARQAQLRTLL